MGMNDQLDGQQTDLSKLADILGHQFQDASLLNQALMHASATHAGDRLDSNERLEFLGDRVLGLVLAELLIDKFPGEEEGAIAARFSALARAEALTRVAREIGLGDHLIVSKGERNAGGHSKANVLADACEAVIAALYLDGGLAAAQRFIHTNWAAMLEETPTPPKDNKTSLQEWAQSKGLPLPEYHEIDRTGPAHAPEFTVEASVAGFPGMRGTGGSKRVAEQAAAAALVNKLESIDE